MRKIVLKIGIITASIIVGFIAFAIVRQITDNKIHQGLWLGSMSSNTYWLLTELLT